MRQFVQINDDTTVALMSTTMYDWLSNTKRDPNRTPTDVILYTALEDTDPIAILEGWVPDDCEVIAAHHLDDVSFGVNRCDVIDALRQVSAADGELTLVELTVERTGILA